MSFKNTVAADNNNDLKSSLLKFIFYETVYAILKDAILL